MEQLKRTIIKTITWRVVAIMTTMIAFYLYSRDIEKSVIIASIDNLVKTVLYYVHERLWNRSRYGVNDG